MRTPYKNKRVFIIGGSSGIGFATAQCLYQQGAFVHVFARNQAQLARSLARIRGEQSVFDNSSEPRAFIHSLDVTDDNLTQRVLDNVIHQYACPDVVINCAGIARPNYFEHISTEQFEHTYRLNVLGVRNVAMAIIPHFKQQGSGHLVNTSSIAGFVGVFGYTDYSASKFAVVGFSEALAQEVVQYNIKVSVLYPPDTQTEGFAEEEKAKPKETRAISEGNQLVTAEAFAEKFVNALPKQRFHILPMWDSKLTHWAKRHVPWLVKWVMMRALKKA